MTEDEKSLKPRGKRRFGLRTAIFFWMTVFSLVIIAALWLSQTFFLDVIYKNTMQKRMLDAAETLVASDSESFRKNAALLAIQILAVSDASLAEKLDAARVAGREKVLSKDAAVMAKYNRS